MLPKNSHIGAEIDLLPSLSQKKLDLSIIIPTRNEVGNINPLLARINHVLNGIHAEVLFVDDFTDDTPQVIQEAIPDFPVLKIRLLHRSAEQRTGGLGGAVVLGLQNTQAEFACVMDGDLQHPPELLPLLLRTAHDKGVDLVAATRRSEDSQVTGLNTARNLISKGLDLMARLFSRAACMA